MLLAKHSLIKRLLGTVTLLYITVGLWMYHIDAVAFKEALRVVFSGGAPNQPNESTTNSYLKKVLPYTNPASLLSPASTTQKHEEIFIMFRTSSSTIWRRGPMHLQTLLREPRQYQIYSDYAEDFAGSLTIDALEEFDSWDVSPSDKTRRRKLLELRKSRPDQFWEAASLPGDDLQDAVSWGMDKYKFMPVLQHAYVSTKDQDFKWYLMVEDDTFIFWNNLVEKLQCYDPDEPIVLGHFGWRMGQIFPHGGSGVVFSRAAMVKLFGGRFDLPRWQKIVAEHHVGDHVLGMLMQENGIEVNMGNHTQIGFNSDPPRDIKMAPWDMNAPVLSAHHVHQRDISELSALSTRQDGKTTTYGDVFRTLVWPYIVEERACWNNGASEQTSVSRYDEPRPDDSAFSKTACKESCAAWNDCLMWRFDESGGCHRDSEVALGSGLDDCDDPGNSSGWMRTRIERRLISQEEREVDFCAG